MTNPIYKAVAGMDVSATRVISEHGIYADTRGMLMRSALTRRQVQLARLLDDGWVFELVRPLHQKVSRRYVMRSPVSHETDGPVVTAKSVERLIDLGFAIRVTHAWAGKTWIYSRSRYEKSPMGQAPSASPSSPPPASAETSTPTSSTPEPPIV